MMGYKIFVSYKFKDTNVYPLQNLYSGVFNTSSVRDYVNCLEDYFDSSNNIYKGESDDEDLSYLSENTIWEKLKERIYDSSVTIVMVSPNMKEPYRSEKSQWIPWEIAYSLRETTRGDRTSHTNAVLAVVLPDKRHSYSYFTNPEEYNLDYGISNYSYGADRLFSIIRKNMNNRFGYDNWLASQGYYSISANDQSYIPSVTWDDFVRKPMTYVEYAVQRKEQVHLYNVTKEI